MAFAGAGDSSAQLQAGHEIVVQYGAQEWHVRNLLAPIQHLEWVTLTPDGDTYPEDLRPESREIKQWRFRDSPLVVPYGVSAPDLYDFASRPIGTQLYGLLAQGQAIASYERQRRGLPPTTSGGPPRGASSGAPPPSAAAAPAAQGGAEAAGQAEPPGGVTASGSSAPRAAGAAEDARTHPVLFGPDEVRHREFREASSLCATSDFPDWPIKGPRTAAWWIQAVAEGASTPMGHHTKFVAHFRLGAGDPVALAHESYSRPIQHMVCYDQLDITNIAAAELAIRQLQLLEERQLHAAAGGDSAAAEEQNLFLGSAAGHGAVVISPQLKPWISTEMAREASVLKERPKAREERALARQPKGGGGPKKGKKGDAGGGGDG